MPMDLIEGFVNGAPVSVAVRSIDLVVVDSSGNPLATFDIRDNPEVIVTEGRLAIGEVLVDFDQSSAIRAIFLVERIRSLQRSLIAEESKARVEYPDSETSTFPRLETRVSLEDKPVTLRLGLGDLLVIGGNGRRLRRIAANEVSSILRAPGIVSLGEFELGIPETSEIEVDQLLNWFVEYFVGESDQVQKNISYRVFPTVELLREHIGTTFPTKSPAKIGREKNKQEVEESSDRQGSRFCGQCGRMLEYDSRFCPSCGSPITNQVAPPPPPPKPGYPLNPGLSTGSGSSSTQKNRTIGLVVVGLVVVVSIYFLFLRDSAALKFLKDTYPRGTQGYEFGCELDPGTAAAIDWSPWMEFSLSDLEEAWSDYC